PTIKAKLSPILQKCFEAKASKKLTYVIRYSSMFKVHDLTIPLNDKIFKSFADIGKQLGKDEVWVASLFYGQAKPEEADLKKLSVILDIQYLTTDLGAQTFFPTRGGLLELPPRDPFLYRLFEMMQDVVNEKFGDGIMSAIDFTANVEKVKGNDDSTRVKMIFE
ncbi:46139_t:CDS:2, partial [Gigaspora margarita]